MIAIPQLIGSHCTVTLLSVTYGCLVCGPAQHCLICGSTMHVLCIFDIHLRLQVYANKSTELKARTGTYCGSGGFCAKKH
jgi:hypothetical protein